MLLNVVLGFVTLVSICVTVVSVVVTAIAIYVSIRERSAAVRTRETSYEVANLLRIQTHHIKKETEGLAAAIADGGVASSLLVERANSLRNSLDQDARRLALFTEDESLIHTTLLSMLGGLVDAEDRAYIVRAIRAGYIRGPRNTSLAKQVLARI